MSSITYIEVLFNIAGTLSSVESLKILKLLREPAYIKSARTLSRSRSRSSAYRSSTALLSTGVLILT